MNPTTNVNTLSSKKSLPMILKEQPHLYDLHTHLLGMGNAGFWIDTILMDEFLMPTNETFKTDSNTYEALCPLVWDKGEQDEKVKQGFINGKVTANFFYHLVNENIFRRVDGEISEIINFDEAIESLSGFPLALKSLINKKLYGDLIHGGLEFKEDFSYDVVLELSDLGKGLGIKDSDCEGFVQLAVMEKLGCHLPGRKTKFQHWIVFNARKQEFQIVYGIQVEQLRKLIRVNLNEPSEAAKIARAHIINAFSMCDAEGTRARPIDLHSFHGSFTPDFYPRRFALKDSIYSQRLDVLAALIAHIIERYQTCLPPVTYCELSVSVNDLSKAWVLDVLRSVRIYDQDTIVRSKESSKSLIYIAEDKLSSFSQFVLSGGHFSHLQVTFMGPIGTNGKNMNFSHPSVMYKFLAGFDRRKIKSPFPVDQDKALHLLYVAPHEAILLMMQEIEKSKRDADISETNSNESQTTSSEDNEDEEKAFDPCLKQLKDLEIASKLTWFNEWVVGLDLFGDELGYPYCPLVAHPFIKFVLSQREQNKYFGVRIHCGENVKVASDDNPAYRLFIAHMYIVFRCLLFLQQKLTYGIRIGHGIAFDHILGADLNSSKYRKSSVLMAEMRDNAYYLLKRIAFEVNITSNEYLLGQPIRQGDYTQILRLQALFDMNAHIILATDDDGIWPIDQCPSVHPGHQSLAAEYCRAVSTSLIKSEEILKRIFQTMEKVCFWDMKNDIQESFIKAANSKDSPCMNTIIVHPAIIRSILKLYKTPYIPENSPAFKNFLIHEEKIDKHKRVKWTNERSKLRVAFVCIHANQEEDNKEKLRKEYQNLFDPSGNSTKEFDFIYDNWQLIFFNFVLCKSDTEPELALANVQNEQEHNVIRSAQSESENPFKFLEKICWLDKEINIRAYATDVNVKRMMSTLRTQLSNTLDIQSAKGTLYLFTNTNKYAYAYNRVHGNITFHLNPAASKRETTRENFLYVLCQHASAATAALHFISEQLSITDPNSLTSSNGILFASSASPTYLENVDNQSPSPSTPSADMMPVPNSFAMECSENAEQLDINDNTRGDYKRAYSCNDSFDESEAKRRTMTEKDLH